MLAISLFFVCLQVAGLTQQLRRIYQEKSVIAISIPNVGMNAAYFLTNLVYGYRADFLGLIVSGLLCGILFLLLLHAAIEFSPAIESVHIATVAGVIMWTLFLTWLETGKGEMFFPISFITVASSFLQPWKMYRAHSAKAVSLANTLVFWLGAAFWGIYGLMRTDWVLIISCPLFFICHSLTLTLYYQYRTRGIDTQSVF